MTIRLVTVVLGVIVAGIADPAGAATTVARIAYVDEAATIQRASRLSPARAGALLDHADHLWTTTGRAEIAFPDGSVLHVDRESHVIIYDGERFAVIDGRVVFRSAAAPQGYVVHTASGQIRALPRGVFGILVDERDQQVLVNVAIGEAVVENRWGRTRITSRQMTLIAADMGRPYAMQSSRQADMFDRWSSARMQADVPSYASRAEPEPMHFGEDERTVQSYSGYYSPPIVITSQPYRFYGTGVLRRPGSHQGRGDGGRGHRAPAPAPPPAATAPAPPPRPQVREAPPPAAMSARWGRSPQ